MASSNVISHKLKDFYKNFICHTPFELASSLKRPHSIILLNNSGKQPSGVRFRYWFGVGQVLAGIVAMPFSGGTSSGLILSGIGTVASAAGDAMDNMEEW